jgi:hypothetical protein
METEQQQQTVWEYLEQPNPKAPHAQDLYRWGLNFDREANPMNLYLDLIGWSDETLGYNLTNMARIVEFAGYMELDYLADALKEYANNPNEVYEWVRGLMESEGA